MGLSVGDGDRFVLEINQLWRNGTNDELVYSLANQLTDWLYQDQLPQVLSGPVERYLPLFMNDANSNQDVVGSYRVAPKIRKLQREWDPTGWWERQSGGFKVQERQARANGQTAIGPPNPFGARPHTYRESY